MRHIHSLDNKIGNEKRKNINGGYGVCNTFEMNSENFENARQKEYKVWGLFEKQPNLETTANITNDLVCIVSVNVYVHRDQQTKNPRRGQ